MACVCEDEETRSSSSICPSCHRCFDLPLILPCSHTLCGRCVAGGAGLGHSRGGVRGGASSSQGIRGVASSSGGGVRGVASSSEGGVKRVGSSSEGGVRGVDSTSEGGVRGVASSSEGGVKRVASSSEGENRGVASSSEGGFRRLDSTSEGGVRGETSSSEGGVRGVDSTSEGGVKGVAFLTQGARGVDLISGGGARGVTLSSEDGFKGVPSSSGGGVSGVASLSQDARGVASISGGGVRGVALSSDRGVALISSGGARGVTLSSEDGLKGVASSSEGGVRGVASSSEGGVSGVASLSQDARGVASISGGGVRGVALSSVKKVAEGGVRGVSSVSEGGVRGVASSSEGGVWGVFSTSHPVCAVLCPNCGHSVELPCFDWSSALSCLPLDPTVTLDPSAQWTKKDQRWETDGSTDLTEEEMEQSVSGLLFTLDSSCCDWPLRLSGSSLTVTFMGQVGSHDQDSRPLPQVCGSVSVNRGQYYWEIDVCNSALYRIGVMSSRDGRGWWFERRGSVFHTVSDGRREPLPSVPPQLKTVGVFLNVGGASITFHNPVTQEFLAAVPAHFSLPLRPALQLGEGKLKLRPGLPPPKHVFLCPSSAYRCPGGAGPGRWRRDVSFGSVQAVIRKFEKMSDSDSGLISENNNSTGCP